MTRTLYELLLRLHPQAFREEFAEEMLWIFDQESGLGYRTRLLADGIASLGRQRWLRKHEETPVRRLDGVPTFYVAAAGMPLRTGLLIKGLLPSVAAFGTVAFLIVHGGGTSGFVKLPTVLIASSNAPIPHEWLEPRPPHAPTQLIQPTEHVVPITAVEEGLPPLDPNLASLLPAATSGRIVPTRTRADKASLIFQRLDNDRNGVITRTEWKQLVHPAAHPLLDCADLNQDGELSLNEMSTLLRAGAHDCSDTVEE